MPKGHKEDCQCRVCKAMRAKQAREAELRVPLGSLEIGQGFSWNDRPYQVYHKWPSGLVQAIRRDISGQRTCSPKMMVVPE